ncbi:MAG: hypothetical protein HY247_03090 [archaeon]|nr:MAG: hypothetical protein HY247_03090 [archaeon]
MKLGHSSERRALSELFASLITIAITLIGGVAAIGFVNGQLATSGSQLGASVGSNINALREKFVVPFSSFPNTTAGNSLNLWIYNNGKVALNITSVLISGKLSGVQSVVNFGQKSIIVTNANNVVLCETSAPISDLSLYETWISPPAFPISRTPLAVTTFPINVLTDFKFDIPGIAAGCPNDYAFDSGSSFTVTISGGYGYVLSFPKLKV